MKPLAVNNQPKHGRSDNATIPVFEQDYQQAVEAIGANPDMRKPGTMQAWAELERIKNLTGGMPPSRTEL